MLPVAGHTLDVRGHAAVLDDTVIPLSAAAMLLLNELARVPGHVVSRADLLTLMPGDGADEHAVEVAVGRLRTALGDPKVVLTVVKRGYRLAYEPERATSGAPADWRYDLPPPAWRSDRRCAGTPGFRESLHIDDHQPIRLRRAGSCRCGRRRRRSPRRKPGRTR